MLPVFDVNADNCPSERLFFEPGTPKARWAIQGQGAVPSLGRALLKRCRARATLILGLQERYSPVAEFSAGCQLARDAHQAGRDAYDTALREYLRAKSDLNASAGAVDVARRRHADAEAALDAANDDWDVYIAGVRAGPDLGVANVEAGVQPPNAPPAGASVAGIFPSRQPPIFNAWAAGDAADQSAWQTVAAGALQRAVELGSVAGDAEAAVMQRTAELTAAQAAEEAAREVEQNAGAARTEAAGRYKLARAQALDVCGDEVATRPIGGGGEFNVHPGVLPDDERRVRERLESLPDEETTGIREIDLRDIVGPPSSTAPFWPVLGVYHPVGNTIELFVFGHQENTLKHEVGHHVHLDLLSAPARERWKTFYETGTNGQPRPDGQMPSQYAATNEREGFAEVYEHLRDDRALDPEVKQLIEELLGELS